MNNSPIQEYRCPHDNKLLFKGLLVEGQIETKCRACKNIITVEPTPLEKILCFRTECDHRVETKHPEPPRI